MTTTEIATTDNQAAVEQVLIERNADLDYLFNNEPDNVVPRNLRLFDAHYELEAQEELFGQPAGYEKIELVRPAKYTEETPDFYADDTDQREPEFVLASMAHLPEGAEGLATDFAGGVSRLVDRVRTARASMSRTRRHIVEKMSTHEAKAAIALGVVVVLSAVLATGATDKILDRFETTHENTDAPQATDNARPISVVSDVEAVAETEADDIYESQRGGYSEEFGITKREVDDVVWGFVNTEYRKSRDSRDLDSDKYYQARAWFDGQSVRGELGVGPRTLIVLDADGNPTNDPAIVKPFVQRLLAAEAAEVSGQDNIIS